MSAPVRSKMLTRLRLVFSNTSVPVPEMVPSRKAVRAVEFVNPRYTLSPKPPSIRIFTP